jgi:hypothetical protein
MKSAGIIFTIISLLSIACTGIKEKSTESLTFSLDSLPRKSLLLSKNDSGAFVLSEMCDAEIASLSIQNDTINFGTGDGGFATYLKVKFAPENINIEKKERRFKLTVIDLLIEDRDTLYFFVKPLDADKTYWWLEKEFWFNDKEPAAFLNAEVAEDFPTERGDCSGFDEEYGVD